MNRRIIIFFSLLVVLFSFVTATQITKGEPGSRKWKYETEDFVASSPAIGHGTIYVGSWDHHLYAIEEDGSLKWKYETEVEKVSSSPAVGLDGTIFFGSEDNSLYALEGESGGLANGPWPMFRHDLRHTGTAHHSNRRPFIPKKVSETGNSMETNTNQSMDSKSRLVLNKVLTYPNPVSTAGTVRFMARGKNIKTMKVEVYAPSGDKIFDSGYEQTKSINWALADTDATGIYFYKIVVKKGGSTTESGVHKLLIIQ